MPAGAFVAADQLDARAAALVVHREAPRKWRAHARTRTLALHDDVISVRRPHRTERALRLVRKYRSRILAVRVHQPEIVLSFAVADEGNGLAIGRVARRFVDRDAGVLRQAFGFAARRRHAIDVAEQIED